MHIQFQSKIIVQKMHRLKLCRAVLPLYQLLSTHSLPCFFNNNTFSTKRPTNSNQPPQQIFSLKELEQSYDTFAQMIGQHSKKKQNNRNFKDKNIKRQEHRNQKKHHQFDNQSLNSLQLFKLGAEKVEKFQQLLALYRRNVDDQSFDKFFVVACLNFTRIIRRFKKHEYHDIGLFLGKNYEMLAKINVNKLYIQQLAYICNLINIIEHRLFLNTLNPNLRKFVSRTSQKIIKQFTSHHQISSPENAQHFRDKSIVCKLLRTTQLLQDDSSYKFFMKYIIGHMDSLDLFEYLSIFNTLLRNNNNEEVNMIEKQFMRRAAVNIVDKKWIQISSIHSYCDLIGPIIINLKNYPQILEADKQKIYEKIWKQTQQHFLKQYNSLTGEEIIRLVKTFFEIDPNSEIGNKMIKFSLDSIVVDQNTQTCYSKIDPIFIIRLLAHNSDSLQSLKGISELQNKLMMLFQHYFVNQKVQPFTVIESIIYLMRTGIFSDSFCEKMVYHLYTIIKRPEVQKHMLTRTKIDYTLKIFTITLQYVSFEAAKNLFCLLADETEKNESFYYIMFLETTSDFLKKNGLYINLQKPVVEKDIGSGKIPVKISKSESTLGFLQKLYSFNHAIARTGSRINRFHFFILSSSISTLRHTLKYFEFLRIIKIIQRPPQNLIYKVFIDLIELPLSPQIYQNLIQLIKPSLSPQKMLQIIFNKTRVSKNKNMRAYTSQVKILNKFLKEAGQSLPLQNYYSDVITMNFILKFEDHEIIRDNIIPKIFAILEKEDTLNKGLLLNLYNFYCKAVMDCQILRESLDKIREGIQKLNTKTTDVVSAEIINKFDELSYKNGGTTKQTFKLTAEEEQFRQLLANPSSQVAKLLTAILSQQTHPINSIKIFFKLLNQNCLKSQIISFLQSQTQLLNQFINHIMENRLSQSEFQFFAKKQVLLRLLIDLTNLGVFPTNLQKISYQLLNNQDLWLGEYRVEDIFGIAQKLISRLEFISENTASKEQHQKWIFLLIKIFWHNPYQIYRPLMTLVGKFQNKNIISPHLNGYIIYLKSLHFQKLSMPLPSLQQPL